MNTENQVTRQLARSKEIDKLRDKLGTINSTLRVSRNNIQYAEIAIEAYELLRLETMNELDGLNALTPDELPVS